MSGPLDVISPAWAHPTTRQQTTRADPVPMACTHLHKQRAPNAQQHCAAHLVPNRPHAQIGLIRTAKHVRTPQKKAVLTGQMDVHLLAMMDYTTAQAGINVCCAPFQNVNQDRLPIHAQTITTRLVAQHAQIVLFLVLSSGQSGARSPA